MLGGKISTVYEAIHRLASEIVSFTDRPDYCKPKSVRESLDYLEKVGLIDMDKVYRSYGNWEDYDQEEE